ncbi:PREDICTED: cilia- and flagella-associated protein 44 isoform X6 [Cercocebus atys]|uniref:cilia- and flagella-associated protein 44 isoform X6 n=1 Tax=Cercocebus atys TaxID=9531 RepID=UPI0005F3AD70|nr:PREDICTED: cilia- and flagella-associated protein 44 isoform X6 [Cercocebus atys]
MRPTARPGSASLEEGWRCLGNWSKRRPPAEAVKRGAAAVRTFEEMKEPDDQDTDEEKSVTSKSDGKKSLRSSKSESRSPVQEDDTFLEDATDETFTEGEESYLEEDSDEERLEGSLSSFQYDDLQSTRVSQQTPAPAVEEAEEEVKKKISESFFYDYMELASMPFVTLDSDIPLDLLTLVHSFGYDCRKRANLQLLDNSIAIYIAGNQLIFLNLKTKEQIYLRSSSGEGIGVIGVHPHKTYFTVAEKGSFPDIIIYEYPSLRPYRILRDGTEKGYAYVNFNYSGTLLASVGSNPDYTLTIWNWKEEQPILRTKAFSQEVFKVTFNPDNEEQLTTSGSGHIKFWEMAFTFTGLKLQGSLGRFGKTTTTDIEGYMELPDGKVLSGSEWGNMLLWEGGLIKVELCRGTSKSCHNGPINQIMLDEGEVITVGSDGCVRIWDFETIDTADIIDETGLLEIEPINELQVDKNVNLFSMIKMSETGNNFWLAQDANGAIWKLDLSFSNITQDPECLFSFHSGAVEAVAVSPLTYLMATTALDCSVRIYDFASKTLLTQMKFKQGGTALVWVPRMVNFTGAEIIVGFEDGVVRILELYDPKGLTIFVGRKKISDADIRLKQVFKPHTARVTALAYERDGEILATGFGIETEPIPEDIEDPKAYSIENARRKREHDKLMKEVEEIKARKREQIKALRTKFCKLLEMNEELPMHMQFKRTDFDVDSKIRAEMHRRTAFKIQQVEKELAWEKEKHELGLKKLKNRFRDPLESDTIVVHAILSDHKISSYRLVQPSKYSKFKRTSQSERKPSKLDRFEKEGTGRKDSQRDAGGSIAIQEESIIEKGKKFRPKTLSEIMVENQIEKTRKLILKAERAQLKIQQRKKEWEELYKSKPGDDYEDPKDLQAIKEAQVYMGDFNLKTAPDYKIPEHMRINAAKKEEELGHLDSLVHGNKRYMNKCILSLRDLKVAVVEEIQCLVQELKNIQSTLHVSKHIPIPQIPQIHPEEVPEKRFQYDEETLLNFKQQHMKSDDEKSPGVEQTGSGGPGGGFLKLSSGKDGDLTTRDSMSRSSKASTLSLDIPKYMEFEKAEPTDVELEIMKRDEIKHVYMQQYLVNRVKELIVTFDAELRLLRHQKLKLDTQMKLSDLHHVTLFQEILLLKNFEKQENILQERVNSLDKEEQYMQWKINETLKEMEEKKNEITKLQEQEKALYAGFQTAIGENNKFANFLMKVLKKKIKRVKKKEVEGDADEDEESEESSEEESSLESDEDESESEDEVFDDSICPTNCDVALFELTLQLREKRLDIEEALVEEKKVVDNLKKEYDTLSKKVKIVATNLNAAEEALEAYQREKQQRLNELLVVIPLKLHQIEYVVFGEIPSDLSGTLVFSNHALRQLQERIRELQEENSKQQKLNKEWRERRKQLIREKREMTKTIHKMEETVRQLMISKFGRVVNLEALQTLSVNTTLEELKIRKLRKELANAKEMKMWEEKIAQMRWELMMKTKEHTRKLYQMNDLCIEKKKLDSRLNTLQNQQGNAFQSLREADVVAREEVTELIQLQAERISALKEEIALLRRKGGLILPPIRSPQEKEMQPADL